MIRVGTSGFSFGDWTGRIYPQRFQKKDMLTYYERELGFDVVEINSTYYRIPSAKALEEMVKKTSENFEFIVCSHRDMTHDIWVDKKGGKIKENADVFATFREGIQPLIETNKLGCVLLQYPFFFWPTMQNADYLYICRERLREVPLVVEFRNGAWAKDDKILRRTLALLDGNGMGFCIVDGPKLPGLMPVIPAVTGKFGYLKLYGRGFGSSGNIDEAKYSYLYSEAELKGFTGMVRALAERKSKTYVFFANSWLGNAPVNAEKFKEMLELSSRKYQMNFLPFELQELAV